MKIDRRHKLIEVLHASVTQRPLRCVSVYERTNDFAVIDHTRQHIVALFPKETEFSKSRALLAMRMYWGGGLY